MTRKTWTLFALAAVLGSVSLYLNQDWFATDNIQIYHRSRPVRAVWHRRKPANNSAVNPVVFGFNRPLKLTFLKVVVARDLETNPYPHALWHLVSDSNSVPIKDFAYGSRIRGMRPSIKGARPDPLEPGVKYRLLIEAGSRKAEHDFEPTARTP